MSNRQEIHQLFIADFGWSSGRAMLLADMMTEHREMLQDALHYSRKYLEQGIARLQLRYQQLITNAEFLACIAFEAAEETPEKRDRINNIISAREERLERQVSGRMLP